MDQTELYEQLYYNASIIAGFTTQQSLEFLYKLFETPDSIKPILSIFENMCLFSNLNSLSVKMMNNLLRIIL